MIELKRELVSKLYNKGPLSNIHQECRGYLINLRDDKGYKGTLVSVLIFELTEEELDKMIEILLNKEIEKIFEYEVMVIKSEIGL